MTTERMYIIFVRNLNGTENVHPPYAYMLYLRANGYNHTPLGVPYNVKSLSISSVQLSITFNSTQYAKWKGIFKF